ncbi:MAG: hypothetical protein ABI668_09370 [Sphingorhabdus sp.]
MTDLPNTLPQNPDCHWYPADQRAFLGRLSTTGHISGAAKSISMSAQAPYAFCSRIADQVFSLGWDRQPFQVRP